MATESVLISPTTTGGTYELVTAEGTSYRLVCAGLTDNEVCSVTVKTANGQAAFEAVTPEGNNCEAKMDATNPCIVISGGWNLTITLPKTRQSCGVYRHT